MDSEEPRRHGVVVKDQSVADFSHLTSAEELAVVSRIEDVALVIVPESLAAAYVAIPKYDVGATTYVPSGVNVRVHTGTLTVSGEGIGAENDMLVVIGMLLITSPVSRPLPQRIHVIGSVLAPRGSEQVLAPSLAGGTGGVSYYPHTEGQEIKVLSGQVKISGAMLANPAGEPGDMLIAAGQVVVAGDVTTIGFRTVVIAGQVAAPEASRDTLEPRISVQGQAGWHKPGDLRVFHSDTTLGQDFFRLLDRPASLVVFGDLTIADDVTPDLVRDKIAGVTLFGDAIAPPPLVAMLQILGTDVFGEIRASDGQGS